MVSFENNLSSLHINGKPVRKASLGGKVFYEKHNYHLGLVASPNHFLVGGTSVITATLTDWNIPIEGETIDFDCVMNTIVDKTGVYDFGDYYEIDISQLPAYSSDMIAPDKFPVYISDSNYPRIGLCSNYMGISRPTGGLSAVLDGVEKIIIENGTISYINRWGETRSYDISMLENLTRWNVNSDSVTVNQYIQETETTDSNGKCSISYFGGFGGELNIRADIPNLNLEEETQVNIVPDVIQSINVIGEPSIIQTGGTSEIRAVGFADEELHVGSGHTIYFFKFDVYEEIEIWTSSGYQTPYYDTPIEITGEMKQYAFYGGLRIYGDDNDHHYVWLGQGDAYNDENAKIFYKFTDRGVWSNFRVTIGNDSISLYVDGTLIQTVSADTSKPVSVWGGSSANNVSVRNVKISVLK